MKAFTLSYDVRRTFPHLKSLNYLPSVWGQQEAERRGYDESQSSLGFAKIFELSTKFERVSFGQFDLLAHFCVSLSHPAFHVAVAQVHHQRRAALS